MESLPDGYWGTGSNRPNILLATLLGSRRLLTGRQRLRVAYTLPEHCHLLAFWCSPIICLFFPLTFHRDVPAADAVLSAILATAGMYVAVSYRQRSLLPVFNSAS